VKYVKADNVFKQLYLRITATKPHKVGIVAVMHKMLMIYQEQVIQFADKIKDFYDKCLPKKFNDEFDKKGYIAFWNEWNRRRNA